MFGAHRIAGNNPIKLDDAATGNTLGIADFHCRP
jgi:hypothetical protein